MIERLAAVCSFPIPFTLHVLYVDDLDYSLVVLLSLMSCKASSGLEYESIKGTTQLQLFQTYFHLIVFISSLHMKRSRLIRLKQAP